MSGVIERGASRSGARGRRRLLAVILSALVTVAVLSTVALLPSTGVGANAATGCAWMDRTKTPTARATLLLSRMTLDDKISLVTGNGAGGGPNNGAVGNTTAKPSLCLPALILNDAGAGVADEQQFTTAFPDSIAQAATWDPGAQHEFGVALGNEAFTKGVNVQLAAGVNITRTPLNGRNFEYAGEDPYLAGKTAVAVIRGIQSQHVVATVKHFINNEQETNRATVSSDVSDRVEHEIYLPPFEAAANQGHVGSVMCAYNRIRAVYACENAHLLNHVLKGQLGFEGWVMSDWGATHSTARAANSGLDMEMPGPSNFGTALKAAVQAGRVPISRLNNMVTRILVTMFRLGLFDYVPQEGNAAANANASTADHVSLARQIDEQGSVLLKNRGALPIVGSGKTIAVIGPNADPAGATLAYQGYGSGHVPLIGYATNVVSPLQAIGARAAGAGDTVVYDPGTDPVSASAVAKAADVAVVVVGNYATEGEDLPDLGLRQGTCGFMIGCHTSPIDEDALISQVAAANKNTVVVLQTGGPVTMPWLQSVAAVLETWYPGQEDGNALAALLYGDVNPSGKLPVTFPRKLSDGPLQSPRQYPGVMIPGDKTGPHATYSEGLLVGYRWYDAKHIAPLFPFGYGLSYTTFGYSGVSVKPTRGGGAVVRFALTNTGPRLGAEVTQVYVGQPAATGEPVRQLEGFQKVTVGPGSSTRVSIKLAPRAFQHWNSNRQAWVTTPGRYTIWVGSSSRSLPLRAVLAR